MCNTCFKNIDTCNAYVYTIHKTITYVNFMICWKGFIMKKSYILTLVILSLTLLLAACGVNEEISESVEQIEEAAEQAIEEVSEEIEEQAAEESKELVAEDIFEVVSLPLYMEGTLTEGDYSVDAYLYLTEQHFRAEIHDYDFVPIAVFNLEDDSAFLYVESKKLGAEYDEFEIYEFLYYQDFIDENAEFVDNMEETTMNGYDVVYGEVEHEGDVMKFWYSTEYDVPIKIELTTVEGDYSAMNVETVEILIDPDPELFKKPTTVMFINLDDEDLEIEEVINYLE